MNSHSVRTALIFLWCGCFPCANLAAQQDAKAAVHKFEHTYRSARTLRANFLERYFESGKEVRSEAGIAYFLRPGKMRWEYQAPERNLYVVDGKWSWFYVPGDHTATRIPARKSSDWRTPLALLAGEMKVSRICGRVSEDRKTPPSSPGNITLRCVISGSEAKRDIASDDGESMAANQVLFEINPANGELARILIRDPGGVQVDFRFSGWRFDPALNADLFHFDPPKGVAIVNGDLSSEPSLPARRGNPREARP